MPVTPKEQLMNVAAHTFERAARRACARRIENTSMAGEHLALSHHRSGYLSRIHRDLADDRAAEGAMWREIQEGYEQAEAAVVERELNLRNEARELELARAFHAVLDATPVAA